MEYLEEQKQFVESDPVEGQDLEANFANTDLQQGKHRFIYPSILHKFKFMQAPVHIKPNVIHLIKFYFYLIYQLHYVYRNCLIPRCMW